MHWPLLLPIYSPSPPSSSFFLVHVHFTENRHCTASLANPLLPNLSKPNNSSHHAFYSLLQNTYLTSLSNNFSRCASYRVAVSHSAPYGVAYFRSARATTIRPKRVLPSLTYPTLPSRRQPLLPHMSKPVVSSLDPTHPTILNSTIFRSPMYLKSHRCRSG